MHDCIAFAALGSSETWTFREKGADVTVPIRSRLVVNTAEAAIDAAEAGAGVTRVLSYQVDDAVRAGALTIVLDEFEPPPVPVSLVYTGQRPLPLKLRAFLDFATPRFRQSLPGGHV